MQPDELKVRNPWTIKLELVEGCNRACPFCACSLPLLDKKYEFASMDLARKVAEDVSKWLPKPRFEHGQAGEPTMHPNLHGIIEVERQLNPRSQITITTNGSVLAARLNPRDFKKKIAALFEAGVNHVIMDTYRKVSDAEKKLKVPDRDELRGIVSGAHLEDVCEVFEYGDYHPHAYKGYDHRILVLMDDMRDLKDFDLRKSMQNQSGVLLTKPSLKILDDAGIDSSHLFLKEPLKKKCVRPFRELVIKVNGDIILCCDDTFREGLIRRGFDEEVGHAALFGNAMATPLEDIWHGGKLNAARALLYRKERNFEPCKMCNYHGGFRQGIGLLDPLEDRSTESLLSDMQP